MMLCMNDDDHRNPKYTSLIHSFFYEMITFKCMNHPIFHGKILQQKKIKSFEQCSTSVS